MDSQAPYQCICLSQHNALCSWRLLPAPSCCGEGWQHNADTHIGIHYKYVHYPEHRSRSRSIPTTHPDPLSKTSTPNQTNYASHPSPGPSPSPTSPSTTNNVIPLSPPQHAKLLPPLNPSRLRPRLPPRHVLLRQMHDRLQFHGHEYRPTYEHRYAERQD